MNMYVFTLQLTPSTGRSGAVVTSTSIYFYYATTVIWLNILSLYLVCPCIIKKSKIIIECYAVFSAWCK